MDPKSLDRRFVVQLANGKEIGPFDLATIRLSIESGSIGTDALISVVDSRKWIPIMSVPALWDKAGDLNRLEAVRTDPDSAHAPSSAPGQTAQAVNERGMPGHDSFASRADHGDSKDSGSRVQSAADLITDQLGLEKIEGLSLKSFFSEVFSKHPESALEDRFTVGSSSTTPPLHPSMGRLPNPWIFFRAFVGAVVVFFVFLYCYELFDNILVLPGLIITGSFAVPISVLILFFEINTPSNISIIRVIQLISVGGALSLLLSLILFEVTPFFGIFGAPAAGIIEESGKLLVVVAVMRHLRMGRYPFRINALLIGAAVGTGFAAFESAGYALVAGLNDAMVQNIILRGVLSPFCHIIWTAIAACAYWRARPNFRSFLETVSSRQFLVLFSAPVVLHFLWNTELQPPLYLKQILIGFVGWVIVLSLIQSALKEVAAQAHGARGVGRPTS